VGRSPITRVGVSRVSRFRQQTISALEQKPAVHLLLPAGSSLRATARRKNAAWVSVKEKVLAAHSQRSSSRRYGRFGRRRGKRAAPGIDRLEIADAALHTWGLDEGENAKPALILRVDSQQSVSRGWRPRPRLSVSLGIPLGPTITVNIFTEFEFCPRQGPAPP
jgi:hypothetical protein